LHLLYSVRVGYDVHWKGRPGSVQGRDPAKTRKAKPEPEAKTAKAKPQHQSENSEKTGAKTVARCPAAFTSTASRILKVLGEIQGRER